VTVELSVVVDGEVTAASSVVVEVGETSVVVEV
jgi:hypothetical protein